MSKFNPNPENLRVGDIVFSHYKNPKLRYRVEKIIPSGAARSGLLVFVSSLECPHCGGSDVLDKDGVCAGWLLPVDDPKPAKKRRR